jgi:hypothetical protein
MFIFAVDKHVIKRFMEPSESDADDNRKLKSIRGIYYFERDSSTSELRYYPNGMTEKDFEN